MNRNTQLRIDGDSAVFRQSTGLEFSLDLKEFPDLVEAHRANVKATENTKSTQICERLGAEVLDKDFDWKYLEPFIRDVCRWGGFAGVGGRVVKNNSRDLITGCFIAARDLMLRDKLDIENALQKINKIKGLGTPSFASKHLRFLWPEFCPVLDSHTTRLGYDFTPSGYAEFAEDCGALARALTAREIENPVPWRQGQWFVGEVDMALFAWLRGWKK